MKFKFLTLVCVLVVTFSCSKEESSCGDTLEEMIVGTFEIDDPLALGIVTFNADGTWTDPNHIFLSISIDGVWFDEKTYTILSETSIEVMVDAGSFSQKVIYNVSVTNCSEIVVSYLGLETTMVRI